MLLFGDFEFRGLEKRQNKEGKEYHIAHFETVPFDGYLHNFLCGETSNVEALKKGDYVRVKLAYNDVYKSFKALSFSPVE